MGGTGDRVLELLRQRAALDAEIAEAAVEFEASGEWRSGGAKSAGAWLTYRSHLPRGVVSRYLRAGKLARDLEQVGGAWRAGVISVEHVAAFGRVCTPVTAELLAAHQSMLVKQAKELTFKHFVQALDYWYQHADPDGPERDREAEFGKRRFDKATTIGGLHHGSFLLDAVAGSIFDGTFEPIYRELYRADLAEARERLGRLDVGPHELCRTATQRRADALVEMAIRARCVPKDAKRPAPLFTVLVDYETLAGRVCELANGTVLTPGQLLPWLDEAYLERVVFDGPSRVIDLGERTRFFTGATRRGIEVRDRECFDETCDEPAEHCEIDHIEPYAWGGPTVLANGRPACRFHNLLRTSAWRPRGP